MTGINFKPEELEKYLTESKFNTVEIKGLEFNPIFQKWKRSDNLSVNYIICSTKINYLCSPMER